MLHIVKNIDQLQHHLSAITRDRKSIAFVPTMGNLHTGHLALIAESKRRADYVVVSIFVNPTQFGEHEDLSQYPRTLEADIQFIEHDVDLLFTPSVECIYPQGSETYIDIPHLTSDLCGAFRPTHFRGVLTVVNLLFNLIRPDFACFGKKDFQQMRLIERMVNDLHLPVTIIEVDTGRETSGLACSSRNQYLSQAERKKAALLYQTISDIKQAIISGSNDFTQLCTNATEHLEQSGFLVDYVTVRDHTNLQQPRDGNPLVVLIAARLGRTRLIDNVEIL